MSKQGWSKAIMGTAVLVENGEVVVSVCGYANGSYAAHGGPTDAQRVGPFRRSMATAKKDAERWLAEKKNAASADNTATVIEMPATSEERSDDRQASSHPKGF